MSISIGMVEFNSVAKGIETCDAMVKAANVDILRASTVCPGKYIVIVAGKTMEVKTAIACGKKEGAENVVDVFEITNAHESLVPAISNTTQVEKVEAIGILEYYSIASAIYAADVAAKAANVTIIEIRTGFALGGKGFVTLTGDVGAVKAAVKAAKNETDLLVGTSVIPRPSPKVIESIL